MLYKLHKTHEHPFLFSFKQDLINLFNITSNTMRIDDYITVETEVFGIIIFNNS
ncbi:hypothetical protein SAMN04489761_3724 [Tenacibaculum sp. MAR_2009_124]|nr:hypothetical protein SAMN04489761_3724 [Tenacibaculum sp. MAR_2009_124]